MTLASTAVFVSFRGTWSSPERLAIVGAGAAALVVLTFTVKRLRVVTAPALVLLAWLAVMAVDESRLPESLRGLGPQSIGDASSALKLLGCGSLRWPFR